MDLDQSLKVVFTAEQIQQCTVEKEGELKFYSIQSKPRLPEKIPYTKLMDLKLKELLKKGGHKFPSSIKPSGKATMRGYAQCQHKNSIVFFCDLAQFHQGGELEFTIVPKCSLCCKYTNILNILNVIINFHYSKIPLHMKKKM